MNNPIKPDHYNKYRYKPIDVIDDWGLNFNLANCVKYVSRAGKKDPKKHIEDLEKARFYLDYEINKLKKQEDNFTQHLEVQLDG
jgi:hypothetical protein